jgi:uncharacterized protein (DUF2062 family)
MIAITRAVVRRWVEALFHIHDTPSRTAAAFALGVFFGFSPFLGLHTLLALACAFVLNLNRVAVLLGVYSNLPWIIAAYYALTTAAGAWVLGRGLPPNFGEQLTALFALSFWHKGFWERLWLLMDPLLWPYFVGSLIGAALLACAAYYVTRGLLEAAHHRHVREARTRKPR